VTDVVTEAVDVPTPEGSADALLVRPAGGGRHPGVVLLPDAFGIRTGLRAHAQRLASAGYCVLVPNVLYRHGASPVVPDVDVAVRATDRSASFAVILPKMQALTPERSRADGAAWIAYLDGRAESRPGPIGAVGYCMGGRQALRLSGDFPGRVAAAASFHGGTLATEGGDSPHLTAVNAVGELYIGHADNDASMDPAQMARLEQALAEAHVRHTTELYVGAAHGWTQTDTQAYDRPAAERHWERLLELFGRALSR
jgi:carboxymethylenebutenolidase